MAITARAAGTWQTLTADAAVAIPAGTVEGDRMYLLAAWKPFGTTAQVTSPAGWTELTEFTDGAVANGNGVGSVKVACWYKDFVTGDGNPTIDMSASADTGGAVMISFQKGATETWDDPRFVTAAMTNWTTTSQTVTASTTPRIDIGDLIIGLIGIRDDSATMTRPTTGIAAGAITFTGNYVEYPATHHSITTGFDIAADAGYRITSSAASAAPTMTGTLSAAETGAALWIITGVTTPGLAQAQAKIKGIGQGYAQAQAFINQPIYAQDTFTRTIAGGSGWGSADIGGAYTTSSNTAIGVNGSRGFYTNTASTSKLIFLSINKQDVDYYFTFDVTDQPPVGGSYIVAAVGRVLDTSNYYRIDCEFFDTGTIKVLTRKTIAAVNTPIGSVTDSGVTFVPGTQYRVHAQFAGISPTTLRLKVWDIAGSEPESWVVADTDSTAELQVSGGIGVRFLPFPGTYLTTIQVDNLNAEPIRPTQSAQAQASINKLRGVAQAAALIGGDFTTVLDTYTRSITDGFGTADNGGAYTVLTGTDANFDVDGTQGIIVPAFAVQVVALKKFISPKSVEIYAQIKLDQQPSSGTMRLYIFSNVSSGEAVDSIAAQGIRIEYDSSGFITASVLIRGSSYVATSLSVITGNFYNVKAHILNAAGSRIVKIKIWSEGSSEDEVWNQTTASELILAPGHARVYFAAKSSPTPFIWTIDNVSIKEAFIVEAGQAQARIKTTYVKHAQVQAFISESAIRQFGQTQANIKQTYFAVAQAQADTKQIYSAHAQAQADIKATNYGFGQAQAHIKATDSAFAQTQTNIKATSNAYAQVQADIKATYFQHAQAQVNIKATGKSFAQAAAIIDTGIYTLVDTFTRVTGPGLGTADSGTPWTGEPAYTANGSVAILDGSVGEPSSAGQHRITTTDVRISFDIKIIDSTGFFIFWNARPGHFNDSFFSLNLVTGDLIASAGEGGNTYYQNNTYISSFDTTAFYHFEIENFHISASIKRWRFRGFKIGTQAPVFVTFDNATIAEILAGVAISASAGTIPTQLDNLNVFPYAPQSYGQAQAAIKQTYFSHAQAQASTKQIYSGFGQTQSSIKTTYYGLGQAQATIRGNAFGQAQGLIVETQVGFAQSRASIKTTYREFGQAQSSIKATYFSHAQAQADIKQIYPLGSPYNQHVMSTTPWGYWRVAETSGTVAEDETGINDGSYAGSPTFAVSGLLAGDPNKAAQFAVGTAYTQTGELVVPTIPAGSFSIATWLTVPELDPSYRFNYVVMSNDWPADGWTIGFYNNFTGPRYYQFYVTNGTNYPSSYKVMEGPEGTTHFIVGTFDGTTINIYVDGVLGQPDTLTYTKTASGAHTGAMFELTIDEVTVWDRAITLTEIQTIYTAGQTVHGPTFAQAQADIKQTYFGLAQALATIKAVGFGLGQVQANIKQVYFGLGQAQAKINAFNVNAFGQASSNIKGIDLEGIAQAQAYIKAIGVIGVGQSQASIKTVSNSFGQANASILASSNQCGQAQAQIKTTYASYAQAQASIANRYNAYGQTQGAIKTEYNQFGQAQVDIKTTYYSHAQAQGNIKAIYSGYGQAQATIQGNAFGQAQGKIKQIYYGHAQAQACVRGTAFAQAQGQIKQIYTTYAQAQAWIKAVYTQHGQVQATIESTYNSFGQVQGTILAVSNAYGQTQSIIKATYQNTGQAQGTVLATSNSFGQAQADIKATYQGIAQAQAYLRAFGQVVHGQAQSNIKFDGTVGIGQAQAKIRSFNQTVHGQAQGSVLTAYVQVSQAQGTIKAVVISCGQAQGKIKAIYTQHGQTQGYIQAAGSGNGQAQGQIKNTYVQFGQANALIKRTESGQGQAQTLIVNTYTGSGQAQAAIRVVVVGQAQGTILVTYSKSANAQALVSTNVIVVAQTQGQIKALYSNYAQAQALITSGALKFAQAQTLIQTTASGYAQAQAIVIKAAGYGQAQALVYQPHNLKSLSVSDHLAIITELINVEIDPPIVDDQATISLDISDRQSINLSLGGD